MPPIVVWTLVLLFVLIQQTNFVEELEARIANLTTEHEMALLQEKVKI